jgi:hypothetical protein
MVRERGDRGGADHFRSIVARFRPRPLAEAYLRLRTLAGETSSVRLGALRFTPSVRRPARWSVANLKALWAQMVFSGKALPPKVAASDDDVKKAVSSAKGGVGYIKAAAADDTVKVAFK